MCGSMFSLYYVIRSTGQKQVSLQRLVFDINSPGVAFKLPETEVGRYLDIASREIGGGFELVDSMGNMQVHLRESPNTCTQKH